MEYLNVYLAATVQLFLTKFKSRQNGPVMMNANEMVEQLLDLKTRYEKATRTKIR